MHKPGCRGLDSIKCITHVNKARSFENNKQQKVIIVTSKT